MDRVWLDAPWPALRLHRADAVVQANAAALAWAQGVGLSPQALCAWPPCEGAQALPDSLVLGPFRVPCTAVAMDDGGLLWLQPAAASEAPSEPSAADQARLVAEALGVGFWSRDLDHGPVHWDAQMFRIHGLDPAQGPPLRGDWVTLCVHPQDRERVAASVRAADLRTEPHDELLFRANDRDGQERWVRSWACRTVRLGRRMAYGMHVDVTERQRAEALRLEKLQLEQLSREKSAFMARMSHDLRTPMNAVLGFTQLMEIDRAEPPSPHQRERLAHIARAGQQMLAHVDALLAIASREVAPAATVPAAGLRVLCVEDNPVNLQLVRELLAMRPAVRLRTAVDGGSGLAAARAEPPDLLLLDLQLPDIDGIEVMHRLRADPATRHCRIVALSADAMPEHIEAALAAGFDDYWTKPIQFDAFLARIDGLVPAAA